MKAAHKEMCLEAAAEDRRDMLRQTVPNTSCGDDRKGSVADS